MSTLTQVEQTTPSVPSAGTQILYPKVGGQYVMASDGVEKQLLDNRSLANAESILNVAVSLFGGI
jgi:hypothetical protein